MINNNSSIDSSGDSDNQKNRNQNQQVTENKSKETLKSEEKENKDYWDRISEDPASGYGADRNEKDVVDEEQ